MVDWNEVKGLFDVLAKELTNEQAANLGRRDSDPIIPDRITPNLTSKDVIALLKETIQKGGISVRHPTVTCMLEAYNIKEIDWNEGTAFYAGQFTRERVEITPEPKDTEGFSEPREPQFVNILAPIVPGTLTAATEECRIPGNVDAGEWLKAPNFADASASEKGKTELS